MATTSSRAASAAQSAGVKSVALVAANAVKPAVEKQKRAAVPDRAQVARRASRPLPGLADAPAGPEGRR